MTWPNPPVGHDVNAGWAVGGKIYRPAGTGGRKTPPLRGIDIYFLPNTAIIATGVFNTAGDFCTVGSTSPNSGPASQINNFSAAFPYAFTGTIEYIDLSMTMQTAASISVVVCTAFPGHPATGSSNFGPAPIKFGARVGVVLANFNPALLGGLSGFDMDSGLISGSVVGGVNTSGGGGIAQRSVRISNPPTPFYGIAFADPIQSGTNTAPATLLFFNHPDGTAEQHASNVSYRAQINNATIFTSQPPRTFAVTFRQRAAGVATLTTLLPHGLVPAFATRIRVLGVGGGYDTPIGTAFDVVASVPSGITFTYANAGANEAPIAATGSLEYL